MRSLRCHLACTRWHTLTVWLQKVETVAEGRSRGGVEDGRCGGRDYAEVWSQPAAASICIEWTKLVSNAERNAIREAPGIIGIWNRVVESKRNKPWI